MKTLYLDCGMGAAGDMLASALLELVPHPDDVLAEINRLGIPGVTLTREAAEKCGIRGTHLRVLVDGVEESEHMHHHAHDHDHDHAHTHTHPHRGMHEIEHILQDLPVKDNVRADMLDVYTLLADAESHAHGVPVSEIHFHEVGTADAIADIAAVCLLMDILSPEQVIVSPVHVGSGSVQCAHGILPVPAPAAAYLLRDVPIYGGAVRGELCTPTGAALLKHFATAFGDMPVMRTSAVGYGMGQKDFAAANCVRAFWGEAEGKHEDVAELSCNLDDITAEALAFAQSQLLAAGALDVYTVPIQMKKSRPGVLLSVLCRPEDRERMVRLIFRHTTTLGVRETVCRRYTLSRSTETVSTPFGDVRKKVSEGYGVTREKYEFEDLARIAAEQQISLHDAESAIRGS